MTNIMDIAASGLSAASLWMDSSASNLANMQSFGPIPATGPDQPVPQSAGSVYQATTVDQTAGADGATSASLAAVRPSYRIAYDPGSTVANAQGYVAAPNVDEAIQLVNGMMASHAYSANIASINAANHATKTLLDSMA